MFEMAIERQTTPSFLVYGILVMCVVSFGTYIFYNSHGKIFHYPVNATLTFPYPESHSKYASAKHQMQPIRKILLWNICPGRIRDCGFGIGNTAFVSNNCPTRNCNITPDKGSFATADAVLFNMGPHGGAKSRRKLPQRAFKEQIFIYYLFEAPLRTIYFSNLRQFGNFFNLTISYLDDSRTDIIIPHGTIVQRPPSENYIQPNMSELQMKVKMVAWIVSNCKTVRSQRRAYAHRLSKYIPVDIYGKCGTLRCKRNTACYTKIAKRYFFYLAFENSVCKDYRTEKIYRTLQYDVIPIVLGGANYSAYLPHKSYINVMDYRSPKQLADYLKYLTQNRTAYLEYFKWKEKYISLSGYPTKGAAACKLCEILHDSSYRYKSGFDVYKYWYGGGQCIGGAAERRLLGL